ncbi:MAG: hypothetical protein ABI999_11110 [Acidobacteriota bacterium]
MAQIGLGLGVIEQSFFAAVLFMAVARTLITPPFIKVLFAEDRGNDGVTNPIKDIDVEDDFVRIG